MAKAGRELFPGESSLRAKGGRELYHGESFWRALEENMLNDFSGQNLYLKKMRFRVANWTMK